MPTCPHCSVEIEKLTGFLDEATHKERLKAKTDEIGLLRASVTELTPRAANYDSVFSALESAKTEITQVREQAARGRALSGILHGLEPEAAQKVAAGFDVVYAAEMAGKEGDEVIQFSELDKWAQSHPLLAPHFSSSSSTTTTPSSTTTTTTTSGLPKTTPATTPAAPGAQLTAAQVREHFRSPEYRALPLDKQKEQRAELMARVTSQAKAPPA